MVAKNTGQAPEPEVPAEDSTEVETPQVSITDQVKVMAAPVYALMFDPSEDSRTAILAILAQIKETGETVRKEGGKAFAEATKTFREAFEEAIKPFREQYDEACKPFLHLSGDDAEIKVVYEALVTTLGVNRKDMGDIPRYSNLGRPPKS